MVPDTQTSPSGQEWDKLAVEHGAQLGAVVGFHITEQMANYIDITQKTAILKSIRWNKTLNVLDVGCGDGRISYWLSEKVNQVVGFDFSEKMIEKAKKTHSRTNIAYHLGTIENIDLPDAHFDCAILVYVFKHITEDAAIMDLIDNISRKLKPGGRIIFIESIGISSQHEAVNRIDKDFSIDYIVRRNQTYVDIMAKAGYKLTYNAGVRWNLVKYFSFLGIPDFTGGVKRIITKIIMYKDQILGIIFKTRCNEQIFVFTKN